MNRISAMERKILMMMKMDQLIRNGLHTINIWFIYKKK